MPLAQGDKIGPYEIIDLLGTGGMGEVYRAHDTNLSRDVAIKVLPAALAQDPDRLARFEREAKVLAAMNHPNIAIIHGLENTASSARAIVMELVEGPTLADRLEKGALPLKETLAIARQVADALEAAHEKGVVHRDLKPANVKVREDGTVKVLDFGLATAVLAGVREAGHGADSPTLTLGATQAGMILGTAAYMAPEQAEGKPVDRRADIWSFGVVLWEMLTGKRLFHADTVPLTLADVLRKQLDFTQVSEGTPTPVRELLKRCLDRDVKNRLQWIGEARIAIQKYLANPTSIPDVTHSALLRSRFGWVAWSVAGMLLAATLGVSFVHLREKPLATPELTQFQVFGLERPGSSPQVLISPDGRQLLFTGVEPDGRERLWVRNLASLEARALPGTEGPGTPSANPFWSPDSRYVAFAVDGKLKKILVSGGPPQLLCDTPDGDIGGGSWNQDGVILLGSQSHGIYRVSASGGVATPVTVIDASRQERFHRRPVFLPDGRHFLYVRVSRVPENSGIYLGLLDAKPDKQSPKRLLAGQTGGAYAPTADTAFGHVLFLQDGTLMAQSFDLKKGELTGEPVPVAEQVSGNSATTGYFSVSTTGVLAYRSGVGILSRLTWFDRQGKALESVGEPGEYGGVALSPDGKRIAVSRRESSWDIWLFDAARNTGTRLTFDPGFAGGPIWSRDGKQIAFSRSSDLFRKASDGSGSEELLVKSSDPKYPMDWSPEGTLLFGKQSASTREDLFFLPVEGDRKPATYLATQFRESGAQFSPDGRWVVYGSDESGRPEIYVRRFPNANAGKSVVSNGGGVQPRWRRDGREILYLSPDGKLMSVEVSVNGSMFQSSAPKSLFAVNSRTDRVLSWLWDVTADGQRFLVVTEPENANATPITVVLNWQAALKK